jgi:alpha-beta hydrolase superfamily lysophospholipase
VLFCHGLESGPIGRKSEALRRAGLEVVAPDCRDMALAARLEVVEPALAGVDCPVVVGSSYGGLVALIAVLRARARDQAIGGLVLCAPALGLREPPADTVRIVPPDVPTVVIHGTGDTVVPIDWSRTFAAVGGVELIEVDDDHRLARSLDIIIAAVRALAGEVSG